MITPSKALLDIYPSSWKDIITESRTTILQYRNLLHFKHHVKSLTQKEDMKCGISYQSALENLLKDKPTMSESDYQIIKNTVKSNLLKRGLISETVYESYHYDVEGELWDVSKVIAEDPACFLVPNQKYTSFFYELYISISYPYTVSDSTVTQSMAKILATVELLEQQHIFCKITLVLPTRNTGMSPHQKPDMFCAIPVFSHRDPKSIATMSAVLNQYLLRKFFFAVFENTYGSHLDDSYGTVVELPNAIVPVNLDECTLASDIINKVITPSH